MVSSWRRDGSVKSLTKDTKRCDDEGKRDVAQPLKMAHHQIYYKHLKVRGKLMPENSDERSQNLNDNADSEVFTIWVF